MKEIITDVAARRYRHACAGQRHEIRDALMPGLRLRVTDSGHKTWSIVGRLHGRVLRVTLGEFPVLSIADARERARHDLALMAAGKNPASIRGRRALTVDGAWSRYEASRTNWSRDHARNAHCLYDGRVKAVLGAMPLGSVTRRDVAECLDAISQDVNANRVRSHLSGLFTWALERDLVDRNPVRDVGRRPETPRDRVYSDPEIRAIWACAEKMGWPYGHAVKLLLVTAQRRGQVRAMRRDEIDEARGLWTAPTKAKRWHPVPLSPLALEILAAAPDREPFVFSLTGEKPVARWSEPADRIRGWEGAPADFRLHDLRRTAATRMAEIGVSPRVIDAVLDHVQGGVSGIYQRYGYVQEMHQALDLWDRRLREILGDLLAAGA